MEMEKFYVAPEVEILRRQLGRWRRAGCRRQAFLRKYVEEGYY